MLTKEIESKRQEMLKLSMTFGFSSPQTIQCSQELDQLLNEYEKLKKTESTLQTGT